VASDQDLRPRYFEDQYLGADDLEQAVVYGHVQQARHLLGAHTWGISIGLELLEKPTPGGVDIYITPGYGWDGYGRPILILAPAAVPASLFADIKFDPFNPNDAAGIGRFIPVWLQYDEQGLRPPPRGFERCSEGDVNSRIQETFRIVVGDFGISGRRGSVVVNNTPMDAREVVSRFDAVANPGSTTARTLWDESVPHQEFPDDAPPTRWLLPIGGVRWLPAQNGPGQFVKRNESGPSAQDPLKQPDSDKIRALRRYAGVVAESIEGAGGVIRLRNRFKDPSALGFRPPVITTDPAKPPENELVWVEGDMRVVGDARIAGGRLAFRTSDGKDEGTPLELVRTAGSFGGAGNRTLQVVIGPDTQETNRFAIGRLKTDKSIEQKFVVTSAGNLGIGTDAPTQRLTIKSPFDTLLEIAPTSASLPWKTDGTVNEGAFVINQQSAGTPKPDADFALMRDRKQRISFGDTDTFMSSQDRGVIKGQLRFFLNREEAGEKEVMRINELGNVGIGTTTPTEKLEVNGNLKVNGLINGHDLDTELQAVAQAGGVSDLIVIDGVVPHGGNIWLGNSTGKAFENRILSLKSIRLPAPTPFAVYELECSFAPVQGALPPGFIKHGEVRVRCRKTLAGAVLEETTGTAYYMVIGYDK
jgi:hypothetical protein